VDSRSQDVGQEENRKVNEVSTSKPSLFCLLSSDMQSLQTHQPPLTSVPARTVTAGRLLTGATRDIDRTACPLALLCTQFRCCICNAIRWINCCSVNGGEQRLIVPGQLTVSVLMSFTGSCISLAPEVPCGHRCYQQARCAHAVCSCSWPVS
jgi:hypothetical protein